MRMSGIKHARDSEKSLVILVFQLSNFSILLFTDDKREKKKKSYLSIVMLWKFSLTACIISWKKIANMEWMDSVAHSTDIHIPIVYYNWHKNMQYQL